MQPTISTILITSLMFIQLLVPQLVAEPTSNNRPQAARDVRSQGLEISLWAETGQQIAFQTQNGRTLKDQAPRVLELPHLVLWRNGELTPRAERTLQVQVAGLKAPAAGMTLTLRVATQHTALETGEPILVWEETRHLEPGNSETVDPETHNFTLVFDDTVSISGQNLPTPSDYFSLEVQVSSENEAGEQGGQQVVIEHAFLMENQERLALPVVLEDTPGAAPEELVIYYSDMFPFQANLHDKDSWLDRSQVPGFVRHELAPALVAAYQEQSLTWGFRWHQAWESHRGGQDAERLTVALTDGTNWYHGYAPGTGHAGISLNVQAGYGELANYRNLTEKLLGAFHHELFHNYQRSLALHLSGSTLTAGKDSAWAMFSEGTAVLAASVGQPEFQFSPSAGRRDFQAQAGRFITEDLGKPYSQVEPYHTALYWRFLYEKCGGMQNGINDPQQGMRIIRRVLETLYGGEVVDIQLVSDMDSYLPVIMDHALQGSACLFASYAESQAAFVAAIDSLGSDGGRCVVAGLPEDCGLYDPNHLYPAPAASTAR